jgi:hypothetical protein
MEDQQEVHLRIRTRELIGRDIEDREVERICSMADSSCSTWGNYSLYCGVLVCICVYVMESMSVLSEI